MDITFFCNIHVFISEKGGKYDDYRIWQGI